MTCGSGAGISIKKSEPKHNGFGSLLLLLFSTVLQQSYIGNQSTFRSAEVMTQ